MTKALALFGFLILGFWAVLLLQESFSPHPSEHTQPQPTARSIYVDGCVKELMATYAATPSEAIDACYKRWDRLLEGR